MSESTLNRLAGECCDGLSRRQFLVRTGAAAGTAATALYMPRLAHAVPQSNRPALIVIFLRGGADSLSWCAPVNDLLYQSSRPTLAVQAPSSGSRAWLSQSRGLSLPPSAVDPTLNGNDLALPFQNGDLAFVQGVGLTGNSRSHFEAMNFMEAGINPGSANNTGQGWFTRYLNQFIIPNVSIRGVSHGALPVASLLGSSKVPAVENVTSMVFPGAAVSAIERQARLTAMYAGSPHQILKDAAGDSLTALSLFPAVNYSTNQVYPANAFGDALKRTAALLKATTFTLEAVHIDYDGWDHHDTQVVNGPSTSAEPTFWGMARNVSQALGAFYQDMGGMTPSKPYLVAVVSEFGRRVAENASLGTDHGTGGVMMVMGDGVSGAPVADHVYFPNWTAASSLSSFLAPNGEDLGNLTDYRMILGELMVKRLTVPLGAAGVGQVFPGFTFPTQPSGFPGVVA